MSDKATDDFSELQAFVAGSLKAIMDGISEAQPNAQMKSLPKNDVQLAIREGRVLVTSRNEQWDGVAAPVSVSHWTPEEGARFLLARTGQKDHEAALSVASDLGGLVLALEHAAAYMLSGEGLPLAEYRRRWQPLRFIPLRNRLPRRRQEHRIRLHLRQTFRHNLIRQRSGGIPGNTLHRQRQTGCGRFLITGITFYH